MPNLRLAVVFAACLASAYAGDPMAAAEQNAIVNKYCAVCHTDAVPYGGISLQHFDAASASPSLIAMMLSKLTGGVALDTVNKADSDAAAARLIARKSKSGAMGAAGIPRPDDASVDALIRAFAARSARAAEWSIEQNAASMFTASILREAPSRANAGEAESYRVVLSCDSTTRQGSALLAWSPTPQKGTVMLAADGRAAVEHPVDGGRTMANAGLFLEGFRLPAESLVVRDLFPGESVTFPFANLPGEARKVLQACFVAH